MVSYKKQGLSEAGKEQVGAAKVKPDKTEDNVGSQPLDLAVCASFRDVYKP